MSTPFIDFLPAQVVSNKEVYVSYHVLDPISGKFKRRRIRCNRIKNRRERLRYAQLVCAETNRRLYRGWNPLTGEGEAERKPITVAQAAQSQSVGLHRPVEQRRRTQPSARL